MKLTRVRHEDGVFLARIEDDEAVLLLEESDHPAHDALREAIAADIDLGGSGKSVPLSEVQLLAPIVNPGKFLAIGMNYADHARESGAEPPTAPIAFTKAVTSIIGPDEVIRYRKDQSTKVDYEAELAVVIAKRTRDVTKAEAPSHVFGYTICNDVSARDAQFADGQWVRGKSFDTFAPLGPVLVTPEDIPDVQDLTVRLRVNDKVLQDGTTKEMIFPVAELISYLSHSMTLEPGDVIITGTPYGVGFARTPPVFLLNGDVVEVEIEGLGVLRNTVEVEPDL